MVLGKLIAPWLTITVRQWLLLIEVGYSLASSWLLPPINQQRPSRGALECTNLDNYHMITQEPAHKESCSLHLS